VKRHSTDFVSAIAGLLFVFLGAVMLGGRVEVDDFSGAWALPALLIAVGLVVAAAAANRHKSVRDAERMAPEEAGETIERVLE
jgi:drug/metabolite transporter (DMT)-like permease